jgi:small redox-active disulfide protein 2
MAQGDVTQIRVGGHAIGIMGLHEAMESIAKDFEGRPDPEVEAELLKRLSGKNYIPPPAKDAYGKAFLREFKRYLGKPFDEEICEGLEIKVLGSGCARCDSLERELIEVMAETDLKADIEHVRDIKEIGRYGVMGSPALIINGEVKSVGRIPPRREIIEWLRAATKNGVSE